MIWGEGDIDSKWSAYSNNNHNNNAGYLSALLHSVRELRPVTKAWEEVMVAVELYYNYIKLIRNYIGKIEMLKAST